LALVRDVEDLADLGDTAKDVARDELRQEVVLVRLADARAAEGVASMDFVIVFSSFRTHLFLGQGGIVKVIFEVH
jgi:hypothetical protein